LAEIILDIADAVELELPPLSVAARDDIVARIGFITGDGNPLGAWGSGTFVANLPQALDLFDTSPDHDIVVFCRDNSDDPAFNTPELVHTYIELFTRAAAQSRKPHYLLHSRPGVMDRALVAQLREHGVASKVAAPFRRRQLASAGLRPAPELGHAQPLVRRYETRRWQRAPGRVARRRRSAAWCAGPASRAPRAGRAGSRCRAPHRTARRCKAAD
jgi:hypothetical protein